MKIYEVNIEAYRTILVEAKSEDEALEAADDETSFGDFEHDQTSAREVGGRELESLRKHYKLIKA